MDLEARILSGKGLSYSPPSSPRHSSSGSRSPSPDPLFPADEDLSDSDVSLSRFGVPSQSNDASAYINTPENGTGVKSVIRDRNEAVRRDQERRKKFIRDKNNRLEKIALVTTTYGQDEELRRLEKAAEEGLDEREVINKRMFERPTRFGHLREVGPSTFVDAIDGVPKDTWVVLHVYDPASSRCHDLDAILARIARQYPDTKFIRARAKAIGFATFMPTAPPRPSNFLSNFSKTYDEDDEDDGSEYEIQEFQDNEVDPDLFPTMLIYRGGELVYTWIRVDWEADGWAKRKEGSSTDSPIEALLIGHNIVRPLKQGNCGFSSDDADMNEEVEDDEIFDL